MIFKLWLFIIGQDFNNNGPCNITIPATAVSTSFDIAIYDDNILEANESFTLTIVKTSMNSSNVTIGGISQAIVTILDDESK